ncbi:hypothetical protein KR94_19850 [Pantoea ananatis]|nr:hypothetical protein KR94_19850 [Pantoea ananatis]
MGLTDFYACACGDYNMPVFDRLCVFDRFDCRECPTNPIERNKVKQHDDYSAEIAAFLLL